MRSFLGLYLLAAASVAAACTTSSAPPGCDGVAIDAAKELVIVEPSVVAGARASNASNGAMSFRRAASGFAGSIASAYAEVAPDRAAAFEARVVCPWLRRSPANACDATCASCTHRQLDLAKAPFRLAAITNRVDLGDQPDALSPAGEGRLVFVATDGPGDDPASREIDMTIIVEYALDGERAARARELHQLSRYTSFSDAFVEDLSAIVARWSRIAQVRVADAAFGEGQVFAELAPKDGELHARGLRNTPDPRIDEAAIATLVTKSEASVIDGSWVLPEAYRAKTIDGAHRWALPGVSAEGEKAFTLATCNGCHAEGERGFQIVPGRAGEARLSPFLARDSAETKRRSDRVSSILCAP